MRGSFIVQLKQLSADVAHVAQSRLEQLKKEIEEAEQLKKTAQAELDMAKAAASQADTFEPEVGGTYQCPYCWVRRDHSLCPKAHSFKRKQRGPIPVHHL